MFRRLSEICGTFPAILELRRGLFRALIKQTTNYKSENEY